MKNKNKRVEDISSIIKSEMGLGGKALSKNFPRRKFSSDDEKKLKKSLAICERVCLPPMVLVLLPSKVRKTCVKYVIA
jgi:hypothetical protein